MPMRRETIKALEQRRDNVVHERKQSKMLTLGASNSQNNNKVCSILIHFMTILYTRWWGNRVHGIRGTKGF